MNWNKRYRLFMFLSRFPFQAFIYLTTPYTPLDREWWFLTITSDFPMLVYYYLFIKTEQEE